MLNKDYFFSSVCKKISTSLELSDKAGKLGDPSGVKLWFSAYFIKMDSNGDFKVLVGTRDKPAGISLSDDDLVVMYEEGDYMNYVIWEKSDFLDRFKANFTKLKKSMDNQFKNMVYGGNVEMFKDDPS